ncbi:MAG: transposase [Gammaproteobacteria bacterium RIFCSPHIGHO2_12_FULL_45_12]|nr:MAG: transposase [Gammaproteobacteria bacterium RIFCSPHIGHO2_12_FULL_45_12]
MKDTVFQRILKPLTPALMKQCTSRFRSDYHYDTFDTLAHLQTMVYAHINEIKSLRTLEVALNSQKIGVSTKIKRSTLSDANAKRSSECFFWVLGQLLSTLPRKIRRDINKVVRILDSSPIQLRGKSYDIWSSLNATRHIRGLKLHAEYDPELQSPTRVTTSHPNVNDSTMGQQWPIHKDTIYVFDKGYYDYNWWWSIHQKQAFFVTRLKKNAVITKGIKHTASGDNIIEDGTFKFRITRPRGGKKNLYTENLRYINVSREGKKPLVLVTNLHDMPAEMIADLYKGRWDIELFFKWIKQNLKLKKFLGNSANAVKIQIATALIAYLLVNMFKADTDDSLSLQLSLTWARYNLGSVMVESVIKPPPIYHYPKMTWATSVEGAHL